METGTEKTSMKLPVDYEGLITAANRRKVREAYIEEQGGKCYHCGNPLDGDPSDEIIGMKLNMELFPRNFLKFPVHLHHSHDTGMTIGAVHARCNGILWEYYGE